MTAAVKSRVLLSIALLRELNNKINYYKSVVNRNIDQYNEYIAKVSRIAPEKIKSIEKEITNLKILNNHLNTASVFLESVILRLETLTLSGGAITAAIALKDVIKILKKNMKYLPPLLSILVDRLDEVNKSIILEIQNDSEAKNIVPKLSPEALKIIEEAKKISGIE